MCGGRRGEGTLPCWGCSIHISKPILDLAHTLWSIWPLHPCTHLCSLQREVLAWLSAALPEEIWLLAAECH